MKKQPNILFLMSDEHRPDVTSYEGNEVIRTPVLDELARTGVVFRNAYTPSPVCIPGRQCMMAGQLPLTCGCEWYGQDLTPGYMTFARCFAQHAYNTVACGKLHHMGGDQMQGWTERPCGDLHVANFTPEGLAAATRGDVQRVLAYADGRDEAAFKEIASRKPDGTSKWSDVKEIQRAGVGCGPYIARDNLATQAAVEFIHEYFVASYYDRPRYHQPLLSKLSLNQPHYPYFTDEEKFAYYLNRVEPFVEYETCLHPFLGQRKVTPGVDVSIRELQRATAAYYGMIETADECYGTILDTLHQVGQNLDDWIIIYTSDHGEMLGEHGIWEKQKFFEASVRVPLIIRWPAGFEGGRVVNENVNLCDLFATLCDLCDIPIPPGLDSRSLVPLLNGKTDDWDNETISQFGDMNLMIKRDHLKYQYYGPDMPEVLFDLEKDPGERTNSIDDPDYAADVACFRKRCAELGHGPNADPNYVNAGY